MSDVCTRGVRARVGTWDGYTGGCRGGLYRVLPSQLESGGMYSGAGPGSPCRGLEWVVHAAAPTPALGPPTPALQASGARFAVLGPPHPPPGQ